MHTDCISVILFLWWKLVYTLISVLTVRVYIPHFVGEVHLCVKLLQGERTDMGRVREEVTANVI